MIKHLVTSMRMLHNAPSVREFRSKILVKNLPWTVGDIELAQHFSQFGKVKEATVLYDMDTKLPRGFGYVEFMSREHYQTALNHQFHMLEGRLLDLEPASKYTKDEY